MMNNSLLAIEGIIKFSEWQQLSDTFNEKVFTCPVLSFDGQLLTNVVVYFRTSLHPYPSKVKATGICRSTVESFDGSETDMYRAIMALLKQHNILPRVMI
jgi:hypothetical protein